MQSKNNIIRKLTKLIKTAIKGNLRETEIHKSDKKYLLHSNNFAYDDFKFNELLPKLSPWSPHFSLIPDLDETHHIIPHNFYSDPVFNRYYNRLMTYSITPELLESKDREKLFTNLETFVRIASYFARHSQILKDKLYGWLPEDEEALTKHLNFLRKLKNTYGEYATDFTVNAYYSGVRYYAYSALAQFVESYLRVRPALNHYDREYIDKQIQLLMYRSYPYPAKFKEEIEQVRFLPDFSRDSSFGLTDIQELYRRLKIHAAVHKELYEVAMQLDDLERKKVPFANNTLPERKQLQLYERYNKLLDNINKLEKELPVYYSKSYKLSEKTT
jgi:hypothetical protein